MNTFMISNGYCQVFSLHNCFIHMINVILMCPSSVFEVCFVFAVHIVQYELCKSVDSQELLRTVPSGSELSRRVGAHPEQVQTQSDSFFSKNLSKNFFPMRKPIFSNSFGNRYSTFLGFPKSQQENMAISGGKNENGALSRWRLGIKWVLKHIF